MLNITKVGSAFIELDKQNLQAQVKKQNSAKAHEPQMLSSLK